MSTFCRLTTAVALLLHLFFGCSMHHVVACDGHGHQGCEHSQSESDAQSVPDPACCSHHPEESENASDTGVSKCLDGCICQTHPCDGDHPGCHSGVGCSFVPTSDVQFVVEMPLIAYLEVRPEDRTHRSLTTNSRGVVDDVIRPNRDPGSRCAWLCTWII